MISPSWKVIRNSSIVHSSNQLSFDYYFNDTGEYFVQLISGADTVAKIIHIEPKLNLGTDTVLCNQNKFEIIIPNNFRCLNWQDGSDSSYYKITEDGTYYVSAYNIRGCLVSDTIHVRFASIVKPSINRSGDSLITDSGYTYQWYLNGNPIQENDYALVARQTGNYHVEITDSNGCSDLSDVFDVSVLSVKPLIEKSFLVYPNPSEKGQELTIEGEELIDNIRVIDMTGKQVYEADNIHDFRYQLSIHQQGTYILRINGTINFRIMIL